MPRQRSSLPGPAFMSARASRRRPRRSCYARIGVRCSQPRELTSPKTPIDEGSVNGCDGRSVSFGARSGSRASPSGRPSAPLPRVRGPLDRADRRPSRSLPRNDQGVLLRPDRREGAGGQGPLRRRVPRLRRVHAAAQRQGRRLRLLQGLSPRRDRAPLDPRASARGDARMAGALRAAADVIRLVEYPRASTWGRRPRTPRGGRVACGECRHTPVRHLERRPRGGRAAGWGDDEGAGVGVAVICQGVDLPAETPGIGPRSR